jgi:hypothetical protein
VIATIILFVLVTLPFTVASVYDDIFGPPDGEQLSIPAGPVGPPAPTHSRLHVAATALNELPRLLTLRVSGYHVCQPDCAWSDRVVFLSLGADPADGDSPPPSVAITLPPTDAEVTQTLQLPVRGQPLRYPFDAYELTLGVALQRVYPDGSVQSLSPAEADGHLFVTLQDQLPRQSISDLTELDPRSVRLGNTPLNPLYVEAVTFERPLYLRVIAVLLVLLITAAAAYAAFIGPIHDLVINSGALVLGVWGIRSIMTPGNPAYVSLLDVCLSAVIIFLLMAITFRLLLFSHQRSGLRLLRRRPPMPARRPHRSTVRRAAARARPRHAAAARRVSAPRR